MLHIRRKMCHPNSENAVFTKNKEIIKNFNALFWENRVVILQKLLYH